MHVWYSDILYITILPAHTMCHKPSCCEVADVVCDDNEVYYEASR